MGWILRGHAGGEEQARELIAKFGSLPALLAAGDEARGRLGADASAIDAIEHFKAGMNHVLGYRVAERPVLSDWRALLDYLHADMAHGIAERFRVLHLNTRNMLIRDEVMSEGTIDQAMVHVREVIHRAMDLGSASIILVHNHPSGETSASRADIDITRAIIEAAKRLGIAVHDHLIIGAQGHCSLRSEGLI